MVTGITGRGRGGEVRGPEGANCVCCAVRSRSTTMRSEGNLSRQGVVMFDVLLTPEEREIQLQARTFAKEAIDPQLLKDLDREVIDFPHGFHAKVAAAGLYGIRFPVEYGGRGLSWTAGGEALFGFGPEDQQRRFLLPMLRGELVAAEGLTEPRGGSDFFGATTIARRERGGWVLSGAKRFIVGAEGADFFLIYAKTAPENPPHESLSVFLVERDRGVEVQHIFGLMGARGGGTGRIGLRKVWVPETNLVGPENGGALIFDRMMIPERMTSGAGCIGTAQAALDLAARYSMKRKAFGRPINRFQAVSHKVADCITRLDAARGLLWVTARTVDAGLPHRRMVSETKKVLTETARHGGDQGGES